MNQKGFAHLLLIIIILLGGIILTVYLIRTKTNLFPHASNTTQSPMELAYNPFGDKWADKSLPNPDIPVALTAGCNHRGPKSTETTIDPAEAAYLSKTNVSPIFEECAVLGNQSYNQTISHIVSHTRLLGAAIHSRNGAVKYIGYYAVHLGDPGQVGGNPQAYWIHRPDGGELITYGTTDNPGLHILDITNPAYRAYIISVIKSYLDQNNLDEVMFDASSPDIVEIWSLAKRSLVTAGQTNPSETDIRSMYNQLVPQSVRDNWQSGWLNLVKEFKSQYPDKLIIANTGDSYPEFAHRLLVDSAGDGIIVEDPIGPRSANFNGERMTRYQTLLSAVPADKYILIVTNTNINCPSYPLQTPPQPVDWCAGQTNPQNEKTLERYYLAAFLNLFRNSKTIMLYYTPVATSPQFDSETYFRDWDLKIGNPDPAGSQETSPGSGVYLRKFDKAYVYWNNSNSSYQIQGASGLFTPEGTSIENYLVGPKSGQIFVAQAVLNDWNPSAATATPTPTATPTFTPTPTPTPTAIPTPTPTPRSPQILSQNNVTVARNICVGSTTSVELSWPQAAVPNPIYVVFRNDPDGQRRGLGQTNFTYIGDTPTVNQTYKYEVLVSSNGSVYPIGEATIVTGSCN